jgi:GTP-binding protein Era
MPWSPGIFYHEERQMTDAAPDSRFALAQVLGAPNAGKSTLVNRLVGSKVSIVTKKVQTTRFPIRGVMIEGASQVVLVDTPGVFEPRRRLDRAMVRSAWAGVADAEMLLHIVDAEGEIAVMEGAATSAQRRSAADDQAILNRFQRERRRPLLILNKVDAVKREKLLALTEARAALGLYDEVFMISAEKGSGVAHMKSGLAARAPLGPWRYPADQSADLPVRLLAAEITREKLYLRVHEELPYAAMVETTAFEERKDGSARIEQTITVERDGQRAILLGKAGQTLKWIGQKAREELGEILDRQVHLFLHVKVDERWQDRREVYEEAGLDFDAG